MASDMYNLFISWNGGGGLLYLNDFLAACGAHGLRWYQLERESAAGNSESSL